MSKAQIEYELFDVVPVYLDPNSAVTLDLQEKKVAVHLHLFYADLLEDCLRALSNIPVKFDLFVSVPENANVESYRAIFLSRLSYAGRVEVLPVPNRGRNIAPLIITFGRDLCNYDIIAHFHTKKSPHICGGDVWFSNVLNVMFGSSQTVQQILGLIARDGKIVYPAGNFVSDRDAGWSDNHDIARDLLDRYFQLSIDDFPIAEFPQGAMFWARAASVKAFLSLPLAYTDFDLEPIAPDGAIAHALERLLLISAKQFQGRNYRIETPALSSGLQREHEAQFDFADHITHRGIKLLAYYLPQFHPIPENDDWHGKGFTEWFKVRSANPLFVDHYQQRIPHEDIGYYTISGTETLRIQSEMMRKSGVYGMIFYHYWFSGRLILDEPARDLLGDPSVDMPYCFCWANENWTRRWDGNEAEILLKQDYSLTDARAFIRYLIPFFKDPRHIKVGGRPVLFVYRPASIENTQGYLNVWREECEKEGLAPPFVVATLTRGASSSEEYGMDAAVERVLHDWTAGAVPELKTSLTAYEQIDGSVLDYNSVADHYMAKTYSADFNLFRSIVPAWDNTARYSAGAFLLHNFSAQKMQHWLEFLIEDANNRLTEDRRFVVVNAWNEWAEGAHLEPDSRYGYGFLNSVGRALSGISYDSTEHLFPGCQRSLAISIIPGAQDCLDEDPSLKRKFVLTLAVAIRQEQFSVRSCDAALACELGKLGVRICPDDGIADFCLTFHAPVIMSGLSLDRLIATSSRFEKVNVLAPMINVPAFNQSTSPNKRAWGAVVHKNTFERKPDSFVQWSAPSFLLTPSTITSVAEFDVVRTVVRFHKGADERLLRNALYSLVSQKGCHVQPWIALQDVDDSWCRQFEASLEEFPWEPGCYPVVRRHSSSGDRRDLRSVMMNETLKEIKRGYAAFLDYDDILYQDAYSKLISRLKQVDKKATFGRVYSAFVDADSGALIRREPVYVDGSSYDDLLVDNFIPLHSFLLNLDKIDTNALQYDKNMTYMEDYYMLLQVFDKSEVDWASLKHNTFIGDYIHRVGAKSANTLALSSDEERRRVIQSESYIRSVALIKEIGGLRRKKKYA